MEVSQSLVSELPAAPLLSCVRSGGGGTQVTVVGVVPAPPEHVFGIFAEPSAKVFTDLRSVKELGRTQQQRACGSGDLVSQLKVEQVARINVLRYPVDARMTVQLDCNHTTKQVRLRLLRGNTFMKRYEATTTVLGFTPGSSGGSTAAGLPPGIEEALGPDCWRQVSDQLDLLHTASSSSSSGASSTSKSSGGASSVGKSSGSKSRSKSMSTSGGSGGTLLACRQAQQAAQQQAQHKHSLVIMQQKMQLALRPPPGLGGMVRGQVRRQFERMFADLHRACQAVAVAAPQPVAQPAALPQQPPSLHEQIGAWLRSKPLMGLGPLVERQ